MKLLFTRHGKVDSNDKKIYNGQTEEPLTIEGKWQAKKLAERLKTERVDQIISSGSLRAVQTAEIINESINTKITIEKNLKEIHFGIFENKSIQYIRDNYKEIYEKRKKDKFNYRLPDGESYKDIYDRVTPVIKKLAENSGTYLLVTHATVIKVLLYLLAKESLEDIEKRIYKNTCLFKFDAKMKGGELTVSPEIFNSTEHLINS